MSEAPQNPLREIEIELSESGARGDEEEEDEEKERVVEKMMRRRGEGRWGRMLMRTTSVSLASGGLVGGILAYCALLIGSAILSGKSYSREAAAAACGLLMIIWWLTQAAPMAVTALLPVVLMPLTGAASAQLVSSAYLSDPIMFFVGSLLVAAAIERHGLHLRIARWVLRRCGDEDPRLVLLGLILASAFLSMWISNTATASMMAPLAAATVQERAKRLRSFNSVDNSLWSVDDDDDDDDDPLTSIELGPPPEEEKQHKKRKKQRRLAALPEDEELVGASSSDDDDDNVALVVDDARLSAEESLSVATALGVAFGCSLGGLATLTGTGPNVVLLAVLTAHHGEGDHEESISEEISFASWFALAAPVSTVGLLGLWLLLVASFDLRKPIHHFTDDNKKQSQRQPDDASPKLTWAQGVVLAALTTMGLLWLFRTPRYGIPGWSSILRDPSYVSDGTVAMGCALILFLAPARLGGTARVLPWSATRDIAWDVVFLLGGGLALSLSSADSGLAAWIGTHAIPQDVGDTALLASMMVLAWATSNVVSNVAAANTLLPLFVCSNHPLKLLPPITMACSLAFLFPISTPPNAIAFANCPRLTARMMVKVGLQLSVLLLALLALDVAFLMPFILPLHRTPKSAACIGSSHEHGGLGGNFTSHDR